MTVGGLSTIGTTGQTSELYLTCQTNDTGTMNNLFKLQIRWNKEGDWLPTVYTARPYHEAFLMWKDHQKRHPEHSYRILVTGVAKA